MNVFSLGGSRNIGYMAALRMLDAGCTVTFLVRSLSTLENDQMISGYINIGKAFLVKGDALVKTDVENGWKEAGKRGPVNLVLFTVGGTPKMDLMKGYILEPRNLVTQSLLNVMTTLPSNQSQPKMIIISSNGLTKTSHDALPYLLKPFYVGVLAGPHNDKVGAERIVHHVAGWEWNTKDDGEPEEAILPSSWRQITGLPQAGSLNQILVVRPALLTDGKCEAEKGKGKGYKVSEGELGGWTISRSDVAHFVADAALNNWGKYVNKRISISY
ncbi:hypothetical protein PM082_019389 [Marasmius tenuissimus]|nr:hypothetical protein PM082_019389 [Marasmius tenuissimus]